MGGGRRPAARVAATVLSAALILFGLGALAYPVVSNMIAEHEQAVVADEYASSSSDLRSDELDEAWEDARIYNEQLAGDPVHDPFVPGSGYALPSNYEDVLDPSGDGCMAVLEIPKIGVLIPVYHGTSEEVLRKGAGHMEQTAFPIGDEGGRPVITGHRGLPEAELFSRLDELDFGDTFRLGVLDADLWYEVVEIEVIEPNQMETLAAQAGRDLVTLVTCTPYGVNTHRLLVTGERCEAPEGETHYASSLASEIPWQWYAAGACVAVSAIACVAAVRKRKGRARHGR